MEWYIYAVRWTDNEEVKIRPLSTVEKEWMEKTLKGEFFTKNTKFLGRIEATTRDVMSQALFKNIYMKDFHEPKAKEEKVD